ncbi:MAG: hypothetical protein EBR54_06810 [Flavobacteriia bacterium]|nr:hypothetical protein [Flavobacteriia bacterium]
MRVKFSNVCSLLMTVVLVYACNNSPDNKEEKSEDLYQFKQVALSAYDLPATIFIPDETTGIGASFKTTVYHEEDFNWKISAGPNFELFIEDWGENSKRFEEMKTQISKKEVFKTTIIEQRKNYMLYKRELVNPMEVEEFKHVSYHVYALIPIEGVYYEIKNRSQGDLLPTAKLMITSIKSFKACPKQ